MKSFGAGGRAGGMDEVGAGGMDEQLEGAESCW